MKDFNENNDLKVKIERHHWPDEVKSNRKAKLTTILTFSLVFFLFGIFFSKIIFNTNEKINTNSKLELIEEIMTNEWYFGKDIDNLDIKIKDKALYGLSNVSEIDPHTTYLSQAEMQQYTSNLSGAYVGIGIQYYQSETGSFIVQRVFEGSPAQKGGILAGDILIRVDNESIVDLSTNEIADLVMGIEDTKVIISVLRDTIEYDLELTRARVLHSVFGEVYGDVGYIELDQFGESSASEVLVYLEKFKGNQSKLIIDLRDNGGGYLDTVVEIAGFLIPKNETVLITEDVKGNQQHEKTYGSKLFEFEEIVVLINRNTASASEVLTAALVEHLNNVTVVGELSYGKGTVQHSRIFADGSALKYTTAEWLTPNGNKINKVGITPNVEVLLHKVLRMEFAQFNEGSIYTIDTVGAEVVGLQNILDFLGYQVSRLDGYFDNSTFNALKTLQSDMGLEADGKLDESLYEAIISKTIREWTANKSKYDTQFEKAMEILSGN